LVQGRCAQAKSNRTAIGVNADPIDLSAKTKIVAGVENQQDEQATSSAVRNENGLKKPEIDHGAVSTSIGKTENRKNSPKDLGLRLGETQYLSAPWEKEAGNDGYRTKAQFIHCTVDDTH